MRFDSNAFGKRLQLLRSSIGMTQEALAEKVNIERSHIAKIENGLRLCSIDLLIALSDIFDVSTDYLLSGVSRNTDVKDELIAAVETLSEIVRKL